ncbi:MAG: hypothetical protein WCO19_00330 [Candidatus Saccharibacteria bacterium]
MNIIDHTRRSKKPRKSHARFVARTLLAIVLVYGAIGGIRMAGPLPEISYAATSIAPRVSKVTIPWPANGQTAIGDSETGVLLAGPTQNPKPIASVTKTMTALAVLRKKPLAKGQQGPEIVLSQVDVNLYDNYLNRDGSVVAVAVGEKITQYQALQAMMLPSANNMADSLVNWAFGDTESYVKYANIVATSLGMTQTTIADASGFSAETLSTPQDLLLLGKAALTEPVLAEIVHQSTAEIPVQGVIRNVNTLLGQEGINGIKTGNTEEAGGCFLVSATRTLKNGKPHTIIIAAMGFPTRQLAMTATLPLLDAATQNFDYTLLAPKGQVVGIYKAAWGEIINAKISEDVRTFGWLGTEQKSKVSLNTISKSHKKLQSVGTVQSADGNASSDVFISKEFKGPTLSWRLQKAFKLW